MSGGTFTAQNKLVPGVYIDFQSVNGVTPVPGARGTGALALPMSWGPEGSVITIQNGQDTTPLLGFPLTDSTLQPLVEFFKGSDVTAPPVTLLLWRQTTTGSAKCANTANGLTVTGLYNGTRGNYSSVTGLGISYNIVNDPNNAGKFILTVYVDGSAQDVQVNLATIGNLVNDSYVAFTGTGATALQVTAMTGLTGGSNGTVATGDFVNWMQAISTYTFQSIGYSGTESYASNTATQIFTNQEVFVGYVEGWASNSGVYVQGVLGGTVTLTGSADSDTVASMANSEFITSINNGVLLSNGTVTPTTFTNSQCVPWLTGASAGASYNQSLTYAQYPGAVDCNPRLTSAQINSAISNGCFCFQPVGVNTVQVVYDIDTFTSISPTKGQTFTKNRLMRTEAQIANDVKYAFAKYYGGKLNNNPAGQRSYQASLYTLLMDYQNQNAVKNVSTGDIVVDYGTSSDSIVVTLAVQYVDAIEKVYMTINVQ